MSSKLTGLFRKLTWSDFQSPQPASNPNNMKAEAHPEFSPSGAATKSVGKGATQTWQLDDTITVAITFDSAKSWVLSSVASMSQQDKDKLLNHEQGHYNLVALLARDMFIELMKLKETRISSSAVVAQEVQAIHTRYKNIAQPLQDIYDSKTQTDHGRDAAKQTLWDGYINTAFTQVRVPTGSAPDGTTYKEEILSVLRKNSIPI